MSTNSLLRSRFRSIFSNKVLRSQVIKSQSLFSLRPSHRLPKNNFSTLRTDISSLSTESLQLHPKPSKASIGVGSISCLIRTQVGKEGLQTLLKNDRIPAVIMKQGNTLQRLLISFCRRELSRVFREGQIRNRVYKVQVQHPEFNKTILAVIAHVNYHTVTDEVENVELVEFIPFQKNRILMPIVIKDIDDCIGIKRGGVFNMGVDSIPMWWSGDVDIPPEISYSIRDCKLNSVQKLTDIKLPKYLSPVFVGKDYTFCSIRGSRRIELEEEEQEAAAKAAATAADKTATAKGAAGGAASAQGGGGGAAAGGAAKSADAKDAKKDDKKK